MDDVNQKKKMIIFGIICVGVLAAVILIALIVLQINESKKIKVQIGDAVFKTKSVLVTDNNTQKTYTKISYINKNKEEVPFMIIAPDNTLYYNIKTMAEDFCGYVYNKGMYGGVPDESSDKCHIVSKGEKVSFSSTSDEITKYITPVQNYEGELEYKNHEDLYTEDDDVEIMVLRTNPDTEPAPVVAFENQLYGTQDAISKGFNMMMEVSPYLIKLYPLETLIDYYSRLVQDNNYTLTSNFKNQRALYEQLAVCSQNGEYCVVKIDDNGKTDKVISSQYSSIEYVQGIGKFITGTTQSGSLRFGMNSPDGGNVIIPAEYEYLKLIDAKNNLYLTMSNDRYGVINPTRENKTVVLDPMYEQIGLDSAADYANQDITNRYIIDDSVIVTKKDGKFGLATIDGYILFNPTYQEFGCSNPTEILKKNGKNVTANPTLIIPLPNNLKCVVFKLRDKYGLMDLRTGSIILQAYYTAIYSAQENGKLQYYFHKIVDGEDVQLDTLDKKLRESKELIRFIENFSKNEVTEETLRKQSEKQEKLLQEQEQNGSNDVVEDEQYEDDDEYLPDDEEYSEDN